MNAWDCLAGLLLVEEAGGRILQPDPKTVCWTGTHGHRRRQPACSTRCRRSAKDRFSP